MSKLTIERGFNGVAFVKVENKPALSISSYGNRALAMQVLEVMVGAPELVETLSGMSAAVQCAMAAAEAGEPVDRAELARWLEAARDHLSNVPDVFFR